MANRLMFYWYRHLNIINNRSHQRLLNSKMAAILFPPFTMLLILYAYALVFFQIILLSASVLQLPLKLLFISLIWIITLTFITNQRLRYSLFKVGQRTLSLSHSSQSYCNTEHIYYLFWLELILCVKVRKEIWRVFLKWCGADYPR